MMSLMGIQSNADRLISRRIYRERAGVIRPMVEQQREMMTAVFPSSLTGIAERKQSQDEVTKTGVKKFVDKIMDGTDGWTAA